MSTLYKPVRIETAEQAEALPVNTVAFYDETIHHSARYATTRVDGGWYDEHWQAPGPMPHREVIGWTALVPIEAEEETVVAVKPGNPYAEASMDSDGNVWFGDGIFTVDVTEEFNEWASKNQRTRLVTPWEPA